MDTPYPTNVFHHLLCYLLRFSDDSPLERALCERGLTDPPSILALSNDEIQALTYYNTDGHDTAVPEYYKCGIYILQQFVRVQQILEQPVTDWMDITLARIDQFRVGPDYLMFASVATPPSSSPPKVIPRLSHMLRTPNIPPSSPDTIPLVRTPTTDSSPCPDAPTTPDLCFVRDPLPSLMSTGSTKVSIPLLSDTLHDSKSDISMDDTFLDSGICTSRPTTAALTLCFRYHRRPPDFTYTIFLPDL